MIWQTSFKDEIKKKKIESTNININDVHTTSVSDETLKIVRPLNHPELIVSEPEPSDINIGPYETKPEN